MGYSLQGGYVVGRGAMSRYDPWDAAAERVPGYLALAQIPDPDRTNPIPAPSAGEVERLVAFANAYGPVGALHHRLIEVTLPTGAVVKWTGYGWATSRGGNHASQAVLRPFPLAFTHMHEPAVVVEPLTTTWWRFFPNMWRDRYTYHPHLFVRQNPFERDLREGDWPEPGTERFDTEYRESVPDVMEAALALREALPEIEHGNWPRASADDRWRVVQGLNALQGVAQQVVVPLLRRGIGLRWTSPSLLGVFSMQAAWDLSDGQEFTTCAREQCSKVFRVTRTNQRYCRDACNNAAKQRRYRESLKAEAKS